MEELSQCDDAQFLTCPMCNKICDLTTCKIDENGYPVHELCYAKSMKNAARDSS